jgi:hypothetical protein
MNSMIINVEQFSLTVEAVAWLCSLDFDNSERSKSKRATDTNILVVKHNLLARQPSTNFTLLIYRLQPSIEMDMSG